MIFDFITWTASPDIIDIGPLTIRWYGLLYATTFLVGFFLLKMVFKHDQVDLEWADTVFIYMMIGVIIGARLGHCLVYDTDYYLSNPLEIIKVWKGGLASHGGAVGIIIMLWIFSKKVSKRHVLWILDRVVIMVALGGLFIRTGNLMNHEIIGTPTSLPWGVIFTRVDNIPRHPSQMYEAFAYLSIFFLLTYLYWKKDAGNKQGLLMGLFMILAFSARFFIEFIKEDQSDFEAGMILNMGQLLSIPFVIAGIILIIRAIINSKKAAKSS